MKPILFLTPLIQFVVSKIIQSGAGGDAAKQYARAQEVIAINAALTAIDNLDPTGAAQLAAALTNLKSLSPGEAVALQSLMAILGNQLTLLNAATGGTLLGQAAEAIATSILAAATAVAQSYPAPTPAPAAEKAA